MPKEKKTLHHTITENNNFQNIPNTINLHRNADEQERTAAVDKGNEHLDTFLGLGRLLLQIFYVQR